MITKQWYVSCICSLLALSLSPAFAASSFFCPGNNQTISIGMTEAQVSAACGEPMSKQKSQNDATEKVPVQQLIYREAGGQKAFYGVWKISTGVNTGSQLVISVINNKVAQILMNGGGTNINSICEYGSFTVGDPVSKVYAACGSPSSVNNTFIHKALPGVKKPETWIYNFGHYQTPLRLRFQGGKLVSIENSAE